MKTPILFFKKACLRVFGIPMILVVSCFSLSACNRDGANPFSRFWETRQRLFELQRDASDLEQSLAASIECRRGNSAGEANNVPRSDRELVEQLERATAFVLVPAGRQGLGMGTAFFIGPDLLVTNRHVVESSSQSQVLVLSKSLGKVMRAQVVSATRTSDVGKPDLALLQIQGGHAPGFLQLAASAAKLDEVVAAGYPGLVIESDAGFQRLVDGDRTAAPDLNITKGTIQSLQLTPDGVPLILHTADIARGNSGGPLVDRCGRVLGVNTFINVDTQQGARVSYALSAEVIGRFLAALGVKVSIDSRPCGSTS